MKSSLMSLKCRLAVALLWLIAATSAMAQVADVVDIVVMGDDGSKPHSSSIYGMSQTGYHTPNVDALAVAGMAYQNLIAYPLCSPSRVAMLTGQLAERFGFGTITMYSLDPPTVHLPMEDVALPDQLHRVGAKFAFFGKNHTAEVVAQQGKRFPSWLQGIGADYGGSTSVGNLSKERPNMGAGGLFGHTRWVKCDFAGDCVIETGYSSEVVVDDAIVTIDAMIAAGEAGVIYVMPMAPHRPWTPGPPAELAPQSDAASGGTGSCGVDDQQIGDATECYRWHHEALDTLLGRVMANPNIDLDPVSGNARIWFLMDNGIPSNRFSPENYIDCDATRAKATLYNCGTNVPLIVAGRGVTASGLSDQVLHIADIPVTLVALQGGRWHTRDAHSFADCLTNGSVGCSPRMVASVSQSANALPYPSATAKSFRAASWTLVGSTLYSTHFDYTAPFMIEDGGCDNSADRRCDAELYNSKVNYYNDLTNPDVDFWSVPEKLTGDQRIAFDRMHESLREFVPAPTRWQQPK
jgi:hypothetical protein